MTTLTREFHGEPSPPMEPIARKPLFGGVLRRMSRRTIGLTLPLAGKLWNPIFAIVKHRGRSSGRTYVTPVAARRVADGFIISLAFGAQVDWHRNLVAAGGGAIRWLGRDYKVSGPERIGATEGLAAFNLLQRMFLRIARIDGYVRVRDAALSTR
jgi:hypothetical protein